MRVAIVQRAIRRYRAPFYEALRTQLARNGIELLLFHSNEPPELDPRDDAVDLAWARHLRRRTVRIGRRRLVWQPFPPQLRDAQLIVVEQAADLLLNYRLLWWRRGPGRVAFWGHGRSFRGDAHVLAERVKAYVSSRVDWWFAYTDLSADIVARLGFDPERITVVDNAIDTAALTQDLAAVRADGSAERLRRDLDLGDGPTGLFLGTLRPNKRLDVLFAAAALVHQRHPDFRLLVVGSGPLADEVRVRAEREPWLRYLGPLYGRERAAALAASDLILLPGAVGLVVLDSFAAETPLVTSTGADHGPEIAYLKDGRNGRLTPADGDPRRYADAILELIEDPALLADLVAGCRADASRYSIEAMVDRFVEGIQGALTEPASADAGHRRRTLRTRES